MSVTYLAFVVIMIQSTKFADLARGWEGHLIVVHSQYRNTQIKYGQIRTESRLFCTPPPVIILLLNQPTDSHGVRGSH